MSPAEKGLTVVGCVLGAVLPGGGYSTGGKIVKDINPFTLQRSHNIEGKRSSKIVKQIADSMKKNGFVGDPIDVVEHKGEHYIIDGHHRTAAAKITHTLVDIRVVDDIASHPSSYKDIQDVVNSAIIAGNDRLRLPRK